VQINYCCRHYNRHKDWDVLKISILHVQKLCHIAYKQPRHVSLTYAIRERGFSTDTPRNIRQALFLHFLQINGFLISSEIFDFSFPHTSAGFASYEKLIVIPGAEN
jgi:hypothetical protein